MQRYLKKTLPKHYFSSILNIFLATATAQILKKRKKKADFLNAYRDKIYVRSLMAINNVECNLSWFNSQCTRSRMVQVGLFKPQPKWWPPPRLATRY